MIVDENLDGSLAGYGIDENGMYQLGKLHEYRLLC